MTFSLWTDAGKSLSSLRVRPLYSDLLSTSAACTIFNSPGYGAARKCLLVEGDDVSRCSLLFIVVLLFPEKEPLETIPNLPVGGWGAHWAYAVGSSLAKKFRRRNYSHILHTRSRLSFPEKLLKSDMMTLPVEEFWRLQRRERNWRTIFFWLTLSCAQ